MLHRLDTVMVQKHLAPSREKARQMIKAGAVTVNGIQCLKPAEIISENDIISASQICEYVSRGGLKLKKAIDSFNIDLKDKICMDIGASTGGFTDCMLRHGACFVYAVDVGTDQLSQKLREDSRVADMQKTNIRYLQREMIDRDIDFISIDVSFISLTLVLPKAYEFLSDGSSACVLIKPQFESGSAHLNKKGVVKDIKTHTQVCEKIYDFSLSVGLIPIGFTVSPIKGPNGNIEYLMYLSKTADAKPIDKSRINCINLIKSNSAETEK